MGSLLSRTFHKLFDDSFNANNSVSLGTPISAGDPRSPSYGIDRTPLPKVITDPRSPTLGITRTPLLRDPSTGVSDDSGVAVEEVNLDPHLPYPSITTTPIVAECDVHRVWNNEDFDSMLVNTSSVPIFDLDTDQSNDEKEVADISLFVPQARVEPTVISADINISPISSPSKTAPADSFSTDSVQLNTKRTKPRKPNMENRPRASTPQKRSDRPRVLSMRDANSPLAIVQRRQIAKVNNCISSNSSFYSSQEKENVS